VSKIWSGGKNVVLLVASIFCIWAALEVGTRILVSDAAFYNSPRFVPREDVGYALAPGQVMIFTRPEFSVTVRSNVWGFRGDAYEPGSALPGFMVLGDSFVFGQGVEEGLRFSDYLQRANPKWRVTNLGMMGYCTANEKAVLREFGDRIAPRKVVIALHRSDLYENVLSPLYLVRDGVLMFGEVPFWRKFSVLLWRSAFVRHLYFKSATIKSLTVPGAMDKVFHDIESLNYYRIAHQPKMTSYYDVLSTHLQDIQRQCRHLQAELAVFLIPSIEEIYPKQVFGERYDEHMSDSDVDFALIEKRVNSLAGACDIQFLPVRNEMIKRAGNNDPFALYYAEDTHLTPLGHRTLAEILESQGLP
jgi:hypothetical protein